MYRKLAGYPSRDPTPRFISRRSANRLRNQTLSNPLKSPRDRITHHMQIIQSQDGQIRQSGTKVVSRQSKEFLNLEEIQKSHEGQERHRKMINSASMDLPSTSIQHTDQNGMFDRVFQLESRMSLLTSDLESMKSHSLFNPLEQKVNGLETRFKNLEEETKQIYSEVKEGLNRVEESSRQSKKSILEVIRKMRGNLLGEVSQQIRGAFLPLQEDREYLKQKMEYSEEGRQKEATKTAEKMRKIDQHIRRIETEFAYQFESVQKSLNGTLNENLRLTAELTGNLKNLMERKLKILSDETTDAIKETNSIGLERFNLNKLLLSREMNKLKREKGRIEKYQREDFQGMVASLKRKIDKLKVNQKQIYIRLDKEAAFSHVLNKYHLERKKEIRNELALLTENMDAKIEVQKVMGTVMENVNQKILCLELSKINFENMLIPEIRNI